MNKHIDNFKKKEYMRWFLSTYKMKKPEMERVLTTLLHDDALLEKVHFVEDIRNLSNAILISSHDAQTISFIIRLDNIYYYEVDEFLHQLKNFPPENIYLWLSFNREYMCSTCSEVLEGSSATKKRALNQQVIADLEEEINKKLFSKEIHRKELLLLIDYAIELNDQKMFSKLSNEYKKLVS